MNFQEMLVMQAKYLTWWNSNGETVMVEKWNRDDGSVMVEQ